MRDIANPMAVSRTARRETANRRGLYGEYLLLGLFKLKGYRIIAHRFRCPVGEIDLIIEKNRQIHFVEVKYRRDRVQLEQALNPHQCFRITRAAMWFLNRNARLIDHGCQFDVVLLTPWRWPAYHFNAWRLDELGLQAL